MHLSIISAINWLAAWANSPGGPGLNRDEHRGGRSTFGTDEKRQVQVGKEGFTGEVQTNMYKLMTNR